MIELNTILLVDSVTNAHRLRRVLQRKSFEIPNTEKKFWIKPVLRGEKCEETEKG